MKVFYLFYGVKHPVDQENLAALRAAGIQFSVLKKDGKWKNVTGGVALVEGHRSFETGRMVLRIKKAGVPAECLALR